MTMVVCGPGRTGYRIFLTPENALYREGVFSFLLWFCVACTVEFREASVGVPK